MAPRLTADDWDNHLYEEVLDAALYMKRRMTGGLCQRTAPDARHMKGRPMTTMTDAKIIALHGSALAPTPETLRLLHLARIGAKVVAADDVRTTFVKFDKKALDRLQRDLAELASVGE